MMAGKRGPEIMMLEIMSQITIKVRVTGRNRQKVRNWLGVKLMELAAKVFGCKVEVELEA